MADASVAARCHHLLKRPHLILTLPAKHSVNAAVATNGTV